MIAKKIGRWFRSIDYTKIEPHHIFFSVAITFLMYIIFFIPNKYERDNYVRIVYNADIENYRNIKADKKFIKRIDGCLKDKHPGFYVDGKNGNTLLFGCELFKNSIIEFDSKIMWDKPEKKKDD